MEEMIHLRVPVGAEYGREAHKHALECALHFAHESYERSSNNPVAYADPKMRWIVWVWWTKTRAITAQVKEN